MNASHEAKLDEVLYDYGEVEAIRLSGSNTPQHILQTFKEWCDLRQQKGDFVPLLEDIRCNEINDITINSINKECFDFLQLLLTNHSSIQYETQWFGGHVHTRNEITVLNSTAPKCIHPSQYHLKWIRLKDKIVKLVMNNIKQLKKVSCNCTTNLHFINELVIRFTPINYDKENNALNVYITWLIDCLGKNNEDEDKQCLGFSWGWPLYKYVENDAETNHDIFNDDTPLIS